MKRRFSIALALSALLVQGLGCAEDLTDDPAEPAAAADPAAAAQVASTQQALTSTSFTDTHVNAYSWRYAGCGGVPRKLQGYEPTAAGKYPLFVYLAGIEASYQASEATLAASTMAARGFVAATVEYTNGLADGTDCATHIADKSRCAFDPALPNGAIAKLCARAKADCSKGIVVLGHSLGGAVGLLARNVNPNVRAVATMSTSAGECLKPANRTLPASRHYAVAGYDDRATNGPASLNNVTGLSCSTTATQCPAGTFPAAGWLQVQNAQVTDAHADHCYMLSGGCPSSYAKTTTVDPRWAPPSRNAWSLVPTLEWLDRFVTH